MKDKKPMPFKKAVALHIRAVKDISTVCPKLFFFTNLHAILSAILPYLTIFISAQIVDELAGARRADVLWNWVLAAVFGIGGLTGLTSYLLRRRETLVEIYWRRQQLILNKKLLSMDYPDLDSPSSHALFAQITEATNTLGMGLEKLQTIYAHILNNTTGILSAVILSVSLFASRTQSDLLIYRILNNPLVVIGVIITTVIGSLISGMLIKRVNEARNGFIGLMRQNQKIDHNLMRHGLEHSQTADVRIYEQQNIVRRYLEKYDMYQPGSSIDRHYKRVEAPMNGLALGISAIFNGIIYVYACLKALGGAFGAGAITQYVGAITAFSDNFSDLIGSIGLMRLNAAYLEKTYEFIDMPNSMYQGTIPTEKRNDREYQVEFRNVSFKYPGTDTWALRNINASFNIGRRLAVVGENGSGKTTFIKLLCRLYDPQEGEILLNGIDIRKYNYRDYMDIFSVVFQDYQLLSQPLGANVAGSAEYDRARALKALNDAGFGDRLKTLPDGLDTQLYNEYSEGGVEISGGEAQKIAIARALYKNAPFLILDEPTAALDPIAEAEIYAQLNQIVDDRTAIYISHRLSSCRFCDEIIVFDHGQIIQRGAHDALVAEEGKYSQLWNAQAQYYE